MMIIGCDLHTRYQQIAMVDTDTGELVERRLEHESGEARAFYAGLKGTVGVGIEATGHTAWCCAPSHTNRAVCHHETAIFKFSG